MKPKYDSLKTSRELIKLQLKLTKKEKEKTYISKLSSENWNIATDYKI